MSLFRRENYSVPVIFWHLQKAGGSTICSLLLNSFARTLKRPELRKIYEWHTNCNNPEMIADIVESPTVFSAKYRPKGKFFAAMEPSHVARKSDNDPVIDPNTFPFKYHDQPHIRRLLATSVDDTRTSGASPPTASTGPSADASAPAWDRAVHVIGLRHPLDMAMSAFQYNFQPNRFSMLDRCHAWNLTVNECLTAAMDLAEQPPNQSLHAVYQHYTHERMKNASVTNTTAYYIELDDILTKTHTFPLTNAGYGGSPNFAHTAQSTERRRLQDGLTHDMASVETTLGNIRNYQAQMKHLRKTFRDAPSRALAPKRRLDTAAPSPQPPLIDDHRRRLSEAHTAIGPRTANPEQLPKWWKQLLSQPLFDVWQQHRIRHQVFGNYSIQHLSLDNQLEAAKQVRIRSG